MSDPVLLILVSSVAAFLIGLSNGGLALVMSPVQAAAILLPVYVLCDMAGL